MAASRTDLLTVTRALLRWGFWIDAVFTAFLAVVTVALWASGPNVDIEFAANLTPEQKLHAARMIVTGAMLACALGLPLLRHMLGIVESTRSGDPFVPENAARLRNIGWLLLAADGAMTVALSLAARPELVHRGHLPFPPAALAPLLTVLMIFVLARIFEVGARMRTDLQGTV